MSDPTRHDDLDPPIEEVEVEVSPLVDAPAAGVIDEDRADPPEPSEPG